MASSLFGVSGGGAAAPHPANGVTTTAINNNHNHATAATSSPHSSTSPTQPSNASGLVSFEMPALHPSAASTAGKFCGQVILPPGVAVTQETLRVLIDTGSCTGIGVALWPTSKGAIKYAGQVQGKRVHGLGVIEFPNVQSSWSVAAGRFDTGAFTFGIASGGDVLDFFDAEWQDFVRRNILASSSWKTAEFKGQWREGNPSQGITVLPDGSCHIGTWQAGKWHDAGMYVDTCGNWCKGAWSQGSLILVTHRSLATCALPPKVASLLEAGEVANISAQQLQNEYKGFLDLADKEGGEGIDASRLAKSISNIAYLKSER